MSNITNLLEINNQGVVYVMNKIHVFLLIGIAALTVGFTACSGSMGGQVKGKSYITEGWVDDNTFRIVTMGVPKKTLTNQIARRESAKEAAILNAQKNILAKFKGAKVGAASGMQDFEMTGVAVSQEVEGVIKGGSVRKVTYDADDNCEIIYEVKARGLKKKVAAADWK